jgi:hypothetical protein
MGVVFPNEPSAYRTARNALLEAKSRSVGRWRRLLQNSGHFLQVGKCQRITSLTPSARTVHPPRCGCQSCSAMVIP